MDLKQLKTFICVAECGSLSRASDRLHIVQPALSRHIKLLEHEVGMPLFTRHVRGMELTEEGAFFLERVSGLVRQIEMSIFDVQSFKSELKGHVALGLTPTVNSVFAANLLRRVTAEAPGVTLRIVEGSSVHLLEWLQRGDIDLALLYRTSNELHLKTIDLLKEEMVLASPPGRLKKSKKKVSLEEVAGLALATTSQQDTYRGLIESALKKAGLTLGVLHEVGSFWVMRQLIKDDFCHAILPLSAIFKDVAAGTIEARSIEKCELYRHMLLGIANDRAATRATKALTRILMSEIKLMIQQSEWPAEAGQGLLEAEAADSLI